MEKLIYTLLLMASMIFLGATHKQSPIDFINDNLGKRVGDGNCKDLPLCAYGMTHESLYARWNSTSRPKEIQRKDIQPGDWIMFYGAVNKGGIDDSLEHVGIVYKLINDSTTIIAEQNVQSYSGEGYDITVCFGDSMAIWKGSRVILSTINLNSYPKKEFSERRILFYRL